jgi:hypothetical protein
VICPPHPSLCVPQLAPMLAQVRGVQTWQDFVCAWSQIWPGAQLPHVTWPPHRSSYVPQLAPRLAQVAHAWHVLLALQNWPGAQLPQVTRPPQPLS